MIPFAKDATESSTRYLSGVSALREHSVDLLAGDEIEAYIREADLGDVVRKYELVEADLSNVRLRVVDDACWPFGDEMRVAPKPVVALDLLESDDPRARKAGRDLFAKSGADRLSRWSAESFSGGRKRCE